MMIGKRLVIYDEWKFLVILQVGFRYHHAEPEYLMLVTWISHTPDTIPANASHVIGVGALVFCKETGEVTNLFPFFQSQERIEEEQSFAHVV